MASRSEHGRELQGFMKRGEFLYSRGRGLLGSQEGLCCMQLVLARGVPPVTAGLMVVTLNARVIGSLLHAVSCLMKYGKYWHECAEIGIFDGRGLNDVSHFVFILQMLIGTVT